ncbi:MAG: tRNA (N(6)-L-threonylcarbamoyladenosine(37)-C(2))-methylthiotransferase MtaB [Spirochaetales bacterium]|nr:tRNA (N(6)-L-threonylcarbamoyladenosine(37)-C(2))-methylthiotransferase MtaB [Spirochaetales bacterium]
MLFHIINFGCKLNIYEAESMALLLQESGFEKKSLSSNEEPDIVIINTCTVTGKAEAKCRNSLHKVRRNYPNACIIMCGCMIDKDNIEQLQDADILIENKHKSQILEIIELYQNGLITKKPYFFTSSLDGTFAFSTGKMLGHSRAFTKIQDGCNNFCTYCKIPFARGRSRSRLPEDIVNEVKLFEKNGYREIILTGINISDYHYESLDFAGLLKLLLNETKNIRFRLSSLEPQNLTQDFFDVIKDSRICPHFHMALQSGSTKILKAMNRKYTADDFLLMVDKIKSNKENPFLSSDLILGFPGETEEDFIETQETLKKADFSYIHVFAFSPRSGTKAFNMKPKIPERIRDERVNIITSMSKNLTVDYAKGFVGKTLNVLIERKVEDFFLGKSENYLDVKIKTDKKLQQKELYEVRIESVNPDGSVIGCLI